MTTLDEPANFIDPKEVSPQNTIVRYGLIGGLGLVIYGLIGMLTGLSNPAGGFTTIIINSLIVIVLYVGLLVFSVKNHRDNELGGYIKFGRAFMVAFLVGLIAALLSTLFNYIYLNFIDPDYINTIAEGSMEMYEKFGMNEEQIEAAMEGVKSAGSLKSQLTNLAFGTGMGAIICLIIAAVMKKDHPQTA
jgi:multisubunit Na+/H+ antiporter MnhB subunit